MQSSLASVGYYTSVPTVTQYILEDLITDTQWLDKLIYLNHQRLQKNRDIVTEILIKEKIPFVYPTSGLFVWMNLAKCMKDKSLKSETDLFEILMDNGLYLVPGQAFENKENGWFRMIISNESAVIKVALERLQNIVRKYVKFARPGNCRCSTESVYNLETSIRLNTKGGKTLKSYQEIDERSN